MRRATVHQSIVLELVRKRDDVSVYLDLQVRNVQNVPKAMRTIHYAVQLVRRCLADVTREHPFRFALPQAPNDVYVNRPNMMAATVIVVLKVMSIFQFVHSKILLFGT